MNVRRTVYTNPCCCMAGDVRVLARVRLAIVRRTMYSCVCAKECFLVLYLSEFVAQKSKNSITFAVASPYVSHRLLYLTFFIFLLIPILLLLIPITPSLSCCQISASYFLSPASSSSLSIVPNSPSPFMLQSHLYTTVVQ